jgi:hypothetical protein
VIDKTLSNMLKILLKILKSFNKISNKINFFCIYCKLYSEFNKYTVKLLVNFVPPTREHSTFTVGTAHIKTHISDLMRISIGGPEIPFLRFTDSDYFLNHSEFSQFIDAAYSHWTSIPRRALE